MGQDEDTGLTNLHKSAHKWSKRADGQEWEEKWWESYKATGWAEKGADKWAREGDHVWHERWGEYYDGNGGSTKYTDKWAEDVDANGVKREWGDKWEEKFGGNRHGSKLGETWSHASNGENYSRTWGEEHRNDGRVHKFGKSSDGEHWDTYSEEPTYFEGKPHFGFKEALNNAHVLRNIKKRQKKRQFK
eukprot:jgi/Mesvir1/25977/Mv25390-RA.4